MLIDLETLIIICDLYKYVPPRTPNRINVILQFCKEILAASPPTEEHGKSKYIIFKLHDEKEGDNTVFELNYENLLRLSQNVVTLQHAVSGIQRSYHKILLPSKIVCCQKIHNIVNAFALIKVYTENGVLDARSYHAKCRVCKLLYYHGFSVDKIKEVHEFEEFDDGGTILFNGGVGFSYEIMKRANNIICIGGVSFEKTAEILDESYAFTTALNPDRLEACWFLFRIVQFVKKIMWPRKCGSNELDLEELCKGVYNTIKDSMDSVWKSHVCEEIGCKERYVLIDGNEKHFRALCAAKKERVIARDGDVNSYDLCIRNPVRGNQHGRGSKFCKIHTNDKTGGTDTMLDIRAITRSMTASIPTIVTTGSSCKDDKNIDRFYERTAGVFYIFRPCGIRLGNYEMYTAESLSDIFTYFLDIFGRYPSPSELKGIVYDRACDLHPFLIRLAEEGNEDAARYLELFYMVDIFHVNKHTQAKCVLENENCIYHPHLGKFDYVRGMNTEIAEQSFKEINMFKCSTRKMTYSKRMLFFKLIDHTYNIRLTTNK